MDSDFFVGPENHDFRFAPRQKWADYGSFATFKVPNYTNDGTGRDVFVGKNQRSWRSIPRYAVTPAAHIVKLDSLGGQRNEGKRVKDFYTTQHLIAKGKLQRQRIDDLSRPGRRHVTGYHFPPPNLRTTRPVSAPWRTLTPNYNSRALRNLSEPDRTRRPWRCGER
jgi:hypothetical protein